MRAACCKTGLEKATQAVRPDIDQLRTFRLGAAGLRSDGVWVSARNGSSSHANRHCHAETRLARKLDVGSVVFVVRMTRLGLIGMAKPCPDCEKVLRSIGVRKIVYTTDSGSYSTIKLK